MMKFAYPSDYVVQGVDVYLNLDHHLNCDDNDESRWYKAKVVQVVKRGVCDNDGFVRCKLQHDDEETYTTETLWEKALSTKWRFNDEYAKIVDQLIDYATEEYSTTDSDATSLDDTDLYDDNKPVKRYGKRNPVAATMLLMLPYIASMVVIYNGRYDILNYLKRKYC